MFSRDKQMSPTSPISPLESPTIAFAPARIIILKLQYVDTVYQNWSKESDMVQITKTSSSLWLVKFIYP